LKTVHHEVDEFIFENSSILFLPHSIHLSAIASHLPFKFFLSFLFEFISLLSVFHNHRPLSFF